MPKSKHRKKRSKGSKPPPPTPPKPKASPKWVPYLGIGLMAVGVVQVIVTYLTAVPNWTILIGFAVMAGGLITLSQLR